ncbi:MAG TPA: glycosyltransferase family 39 protein [Ktedonobacteraceae bacterium]
MIETIQAAQAQQTITHKVTRKPFRLALASSRFTLPFILALQALVSLFTLQNSAFQDEALYLLAGRQIFQSWFGGPPVLDPYGTYFSGYPTFYPVIGGVLDMLGGLELARMFSLLCMLVVTICAYYITKKLFNQQSAVFAAALFACQGPVLFLSRLATYDALCLCMLALATLIAVYVSSARRPWAALALGPLLLLAVTAKYAGILFIPTVLVLLAWQSLCCLGWRQMFARVGLAALSLALIGALAYWKMDKSVLVGLSATTTARVAVVDTPASILLQHIVLLGGIAYLLALIGLILLTFHRSTSTFRFPALLTFVILYGSSLLAPAYHIYKSELVSLDKHMAFSIFFIVPLAGYALSLFSGYLPTKSPRNQAPQRTVPRGRYWLTGLALCLVMFLIGTQQAQEDYAEWEYTGNLTYLLHTQVQPNSGHYLAEEYDVARYYMQDVTASWQWSSLDYFSYTDKQQNHLLGVPAYKAAIQAGYFDLIELNYGYNAALAQHIYQDIGISHHYRLIAKLPYHNAYGDGYFWLWRKHAP